MKIVHVDEQPLEARAERGGAGHSGRTIFDSAILGRDHARVDNFYFGISYSEPGDFTSPRHRHTFDQYRYMVQGFGEYAQGKMTDGVLGYFPEGAFYGPQETLYGTLFVAQFGGPSGSGYIDRDVLRKARREMKAKNTGVFEDGSYIVNPGAGDGDGEEVRDAHEVMTEYVRGHRVVFPLPQYASPMFMDTKAYPWMAVEGAHGVEEKALGTFTSCRYRAAVTRLQPGAELKVCGRGVHVVLSGSGDVEGEAYRKFTCLYLEDGEAATFRADDETELLVLGLPSLHLIEASSSALQEAAAA